MADSSFSDSHDIGLMSLSGASGKVTLSPSEGSTARVVIGASIIGSPFIGSAFSAVSRTDGEITFFVSQRIDYKCSIVSLALHLPKSHPHFEERARDIAVAISTGD